MRIDIHAHYFPGPYLDRLTASGDRVAASLAALGAGDGPGELDGRLDLMDDAGIDVAVLSASAVGPYHMDAEDAASAARLANDLFADVAQRRPDRFAMFALLPLPHVDQSLRELDRVLGRPGVVGVAVATAILGRSIADAAFEPIYEELDRRATVLFIHPAGRGAESELIGSAGLTWPIGAPIEDTISVTHLIARGLPSRYPRLRIVNAHLGGAVPMLLQRLDNQFPRIVPDAPELPSVAARRMWYDTVSHAHVPALVAACASFGADHLVLGTDFPYVRGDHLRRAVDHLADAGLAPAELEAVAGLTAAGILGLETAAGPVVSAVPDPPPPPPRAG
jgi:aminocarboxymuconate-semialdehyde decarboxylase